MSNEILRRMRDMSMPACAKAVAWPLADAARDPSDSERPAGCWMKLETVAHRAGCSASKAKRGIAWLEQMQLIVSRQTGRGLDFTWNLSCLPAHCEPSDSSLRATEASGSPHKPSECPMPAHSELPRDARPATVAPQSTRSPEQEAREQEAARMAATVERRTYSWYPLLADFRDPNPGETAAEYRAAQDEHVRVTAPAAVAPAEQLRRAAERRGGTQSAAALAQAVKRPEASVLEEELLDVEVPIAAARAAVSSSRSELPDPVIRRARQLIREARQLLQQPPAPLRS